MPSKTVDLCTRCTLPDCDIRSRECRLKWLQSQYSARRKMGREITDEMRIASTQMGMIYKIERDARLSEMTE